MYLAIHAETDKTKQFLKHISEYLSNKKPFVAGEIIDIPIYDNSGYFPKIEEQFTEVVSKRIGGIIKVGFEGPMVFSWNKDNKTGISEIRDHAHRREMKKVAVIHYLLFVFNKILEYKTDIIDPNNPTGYLVSFEIKDIAKLENKIAKIMEENLKINIKERKSKFITLQLKSDGCLYLASNRTKFYKMKPTKQRYAIVKYFAEQRIYDYLPTTIIAEAVNKSPNNLIGEIGKINSMVRGAIDQKNNLFEGEPNNGYKINGLYRIISEKE